jgi:hypothetical protein
MSGVRCNAGLVGRWTTEAEVDSLLALARPLDAINRSVVYAEAASIPFSVRRYIAQRDEDSAPRTTAHLRRLIVLLVIVLVLIIRGTFALSGRL